jgi:YVTN family beta-propeller protein
VVFTPDSKRAFVSNELGGTVSVVDATKHVVTSEIRFERGAGPTPPRPMGLALSPDGARLYVAHGRAGSLAFVDVATGRVDKTLTGLGERPWGVEATADGKKLFVACGPSNDVAVVDVASGAVVERVHAGTSPWGVAVTR